jgi:hypothetical protein
VRFNAFASFLAPAFCFANEHCSRLLGGPSATTRISRGLRCSRIDSIVPSLPAASRPSTIIRIRWPCSIRQRCSLTSPICSQPAVLDTYGDSMSWKRWPVPGHHRRHRRLDHHRPTLESCIAWPAQRDVRFTCLISSGDLVFVPSVFRTLKRPFLMVKTVVAGPNLSPLKLPYLAALGIDCVLRY